MGTVRGGDAWVRIEYFRPFLKLKVRGTVRGYGRGVRGYEGTRVRGYRGQGKLCS